MNNRDKTFLDIFNFDYHINPFSRFRLFVKKFEHTTSKEPTIKIQERYHLLSNQEEDNVVKNFWHQCNLQSNVTPLIEYLKK